MTYSLVHEIARVYDEVLRRHRFGFFTKSDETGDNLVRFFIWANDEKFEAIFINAKYGVEVSVFWFPPPRYRKRFYSAYFHKRGTPKVRKEALILAKKISMKPVYDIMEK
jgi:hypothetical protein